MHPRDLAILGAARDLCGQSVGSFGWRPVRDIEEAVRDIEEAAKQKYNNSDATATEVYDELDRELMALGFEPDCSGF